MQIINARSTTLMLFRCTKRKYAEGIQAGSLYFGCPENWIRMEKEGNKGQGDILEGAFMSVKNNKQLLIDSKCLEGNDIESFQHNGFTFYRRKSVLDLRCFCLYGLYDNSFQKSIDKNGKAHYDSRITKKYFSDFTEYKTREEYEKIDKKDQPVVVFINNPHEFFRRICDYLVSIGVDKKDILIAPVTYMNRYENMTEAVDFPYELFLKDKSFEEQSEMRIVINSKNPQYIEYKEKNNNTIHVGSLKDITDIYEYYFDDLAIKRHGNKGLLFSLPQKKVSKIHDMDFFELEGLLYNILLGTVEIINVPTGSTTWDEKLKFLIDLFYNKYGVILHVDEHKNVYMYNLSQQLLDQSKKRNKTIYEIDSFKREIDEYIINGKLDEALEKCARYFNNNDLGGVACFYGGKIYRLLNKHNEAIVYFYMACMNDYKSIEALDSIASIYFEQGNYEQAIRIYNAIQDEKGYDTSIWGNIGICYIHLGQYIKAVDCFDKGISLTESDAFSFYNKGVALYKLGQHQKAKECMEKAMMLEPENSYYIEEYNRTFKPDT